MSSSAAANRGSCLVCGQLVLVTQQRVKSPQGYRHQKCHELGLKRAKADSPISLYDLPFVRVCLLGTVDAESPFYALKGNLMELLFKKHVLPEEEAISLLESAKNGDIRGECLVLNWTMTSVDSKDVNVSACWECGC